MIKFARMILDEMNVLTKELEIQLGPDTGDLSLRVGIHSGPVTGGVLRGERARFQLFGDTVSLRSFSRKICVYYYSLQNLTVEILLYRIVNHLR